MPDYIEKLMYWGDKIEEIAKSYGLDLYPQEFKIVNWQDMISYQTYLGMPAYYPHWSFGKLYEKSNKLYNYKLSNLPYEMVINSDPCIAYLLKDNSLTMYLITMAHVYAHNDFFKNNRLFRDNMNSKIVINIFKENSIRIRKYINDYRIGINKVEKILDATHSIKYYSSILNTIIESGRLSDWQKDIINIVKTQNEYFKPQIETKIINEGWATWWHYKILHLLELPDNMNIEFIKHHNNIIAPNKYSLNPYNLGYSIWNDIYIKSNYDIKEMLRIREMERDISFVRNYLTFELCQELKLLTYKEEENYYIIDNIGTKSNWEEIRDILCNSIGENSIPRISVKEIIKEDNTLVLIHHYKGRNLDIAYAFETIKYIQLLWDYNVVLETFINNKPLKIKCTNKQKISVES